MKMMKLALLGTAALAVSAMGAQADELSALKAEIEALNARVAQLETAPAVPAGYSVMTISDIEALSLTGEQAKDLVGYTSSNRISVLPTADAPAAATVDWDFQIRAAIGYVDGYDDEDDVEVITRGRIRVKASMDTAVGAVGVDFRLQGASYFGAYGGGDFGGGADVVMNIAWGWWQMTPELQFGAGYTGSLGNVPYGQDEYITGIGTTVNFNSGDQEQMRLTWTSGPLTLAAAVEDSGAFRPDLPAVAGRATFAGDTISASVSGIIDDDDDFWQVGAGATAALGDMATISIAGAIGDAVDNDDVPGDYGDYWGASIYGRLDITEQTYVEASYGYLDSESRDTTAPFDDREFVRQVVDAGIYHSPVDQLVFGLEANWAQNDFDNSDTFDDLDGYDEDAFMLAFIAWFNL